jgi:hypothetical protein
MGKIRLGLVGMLAVFGGGCSEMAKTTEGPLGSTASSLVPATFEERAAEFVSEIAGRTPEGSACNEHLRIGAAKHWQLTLGARRE